MGFAISVSVPDLSGVEDEIHGILKLPASIFAKRADPIHDTYIDGNYYFYDNSLAALARHEGPRRSELTGDSTATWRADDSNYVRLLRILLSLVCPSYFHSLNHVVQCKPSSVGIRMFFPLAVTGMRLQRKLFRLCDVLR